MRSWGPLPSVQHDMETDCKSEPAQLALGKGKCWTRWMVGKRQGGSHSRPGVEGCPLGSCKLLLSPSLPLWPHPRPGAHITGVSWEPSLRSLLCLALCARPAGQGPSVRDLAASPLWQRVREGGGIISSKRRKW